MCSKFSKLCSVHDLITNYSTRGIISSSKVTILPWMKKTICSDSFGSERFYINIGTVFSSILLNGTFNFGPNSSLKYFVADLRYIIKFESLYLFCWGQETRAWVRREVVQLTSSSFFLSSPVLFAKNPKTE